MLIEQLQFTGDESTSNGKVRLNFNHPVKELVWVVKDSANVVDPFSYSLDDTTGSDSNGSYEIGTMDDSITSAKLMLNGHDRFSERNAKYFRLVQPYQHHTRVPTKAVYSYSFALKPEEHQPSGTCNFSRIDNATLSLKYNGSQETDSVLKVFAVNYNVLRIMSGMGGLAYSN
jgi:hypothetical protein